PGLGPWLRHRSGGRGHGLGIDRTWLERCHPLHRAGQPCIAAGGPTPGLAQPRPGTVARAVRRGADRCVGPDPRAVAGTFPCELRPWLRPIAIPPITLEPADGPCPTATGNPRLLLRVPRREDFEAWATFMADEEATRHIGGLQPRPVAWRGLAAMVGSWHLQGYAMFSVIEKASGQWIGRVGPWQPEGWPGPEDR